MSRAGIGAGLEMYIWQAFTTVVSEALELTRGKKGMC